MRTSVRACLAAVLFIVSSAWAQGPFSFEAELTRGADQEPLGIRVALKIPAKHYLYADQVNVTAANGVVLLPESIPTPTSQFDELLGETIEVYDSDVTLAYRFGGEVSLPVELTVSYQGCSKQPMICFIPESKAVQVPANGDVFAVTPPEAMAPDALVSASAEARADQPEWRVLADQFVIAGTAGGYLDASAFVAFLKDPASAGTTTAGPATGSVWLTLLAIFLGGIALNLTPCVLPMIPINLAIIGAGAQASSRGKGVLLGALYGLGITIAYGALGLIVVLTGGMFGTLTASPWFNAFFTLLFAAVALAMFDVFAIDFSRFQPRAGGSGKTALILVPVLGAISAVLAGACVAPILLTALALAIDLYSRGNVAGLFVPFLLGLGMAIPWPFAGGGLGVLPKPGRWMEHVKHGLGILVILLAMLYGYKAYHGFTWRHTDSLAAGLERGLAQNKPVVLDFWASWCTSCKAMDKTTFVDSRVKKALQQFEFVKYQMEDPSRDEAAALREYFGVQGLPTYVILTPR